jgi:hypoxanthine phosphoribosyltransferase
MDTEKLEQLKQEAERVFAGADRLYTREEVETALDRMAVAVTLKLRDHNPLILCLMLGAVVVTGKLLTRLRFPLQLEYIHATRYRGATRGGELEWLRLPRDRIRGRTVLIVDDILDEGITLKAITSACREAGASAVYSAVLLDKQLDKPKQFPRADFTGLTIPDRYVFGYGMDYKEYLRNCDGIYAVHE